MKNGYYIIQSDIDIYNKLIKNGGPNAVPTLNAKFNEIAKIHAEISNPGNKENIQFIRIYERSNEFECFDYNNEQYVYISIDFLKNENWQDLLKKEIDEKNKKDKTDGIRNILNRYFEVKDKAIEIAKEFAVLQGFRKHNVEDGVFTFMTSPNNIENGIIAVLFELHSICGEIDDQEVFTFPMELLVVENWKEKLREYFNSEAEAGSISIRK